MATSLTTPPPTTHPHSDGPVIIDLGKKKRSQVRKLRKGRGKLVARVNELVADLHNNGTVASKGQPVIVVVREKKKRGRGGFGMF